MKGNKILFTLCVCIFVLSIGKKQVNAYSPQSLPSEIKAGETYTVEECSQVDLNSMVKVNGTLIVNEGQELDVRGTLNISATGNLINKGCIMLDVDSNASIKIEKRDPDLSEGEVYVASMQADNSSMQEKKIDISFGTKLSEAFQKQHYRFKEIKGEPDTIIDGQTKLNAGSHDCIMEYDVNEDSSTEKYRKIMAKIKINVNKVELEYPYSTIIEVEDGQELSGIPIPTGFVFMQSENSEEKLTTDQLAQILTFTKKIYVFYVNYEDEEQRKNYKNIAITINVSKKNDLEPSPDPTIIESEERIANVKAELINLKDVSSTNMTQAKLDNITKTLSDFNALTEAEKNQIDVSVQTFLSQAISELNKCKYASGNNIYYSFNGKTLRVFGQGSLENLFSKFTDKNVRTTYKKEKFYSYSKKATEIVIEGEITRIGNGSFACFKKLKTLKINTSKNMEIGEGAFYECLKLSQIELNNVSKINNSAFARCKGVEKIILPEGLTSVEKTAFGVCRKLSYIDLPNSLKYVGYACFFECTALKTIIVRGNVNKCGAFAFYHVSKKGRSIKYTTNSAKNCVLVKAAKKEGFKVKKGK